MTVARPISPESRTSPSSVREIEREEDPLPYADLNPQARPSVPAKPLPLPLPDDRATEAPLTLDDDPVTPSGTAPAPVAPPPFRTPAQMTYDSAGLFSGFCEVVLVPHGMFLESVPFRPFLYAPLLTRAEVTGREVSVTLPDARTVTVEFVGPNATRIANDTTAFLVGERPIPDLKDYRRNPRWLLWLALIFALGLAVGPLVMTQTTDFGLSTGLMIAAGFAGVGLLANSAVVLLTRWSVAGKVAMMATIGAAVTGVFLFATTAYVAGRKHEAEQPKPEPPTPIQPQPKPQPPDPTPPVVSRPGLPTAVDAAYREGVFQFEEGPDDVTALSLTPDGSIMLAGYKNGASKVWRFDQLTVDPFTAGPRADGPITRIQFDGSAAIAYLTCTGGAVAAYWNDPPESPVKIPGDPFSVFTFPSGERFATIRGNALTLRYVPLGLVKKPVAKTKGFATLTPKDETIPAEVKGVIATPGPKPTFLAWHPTGKLIGGLPDGNIISWGAVGPRFEVISRDHKAAVRVWAASPSTWDFATGDDKGMVGLWANKSMTPKVFTATSSTGAPVSITHLSFSPSGSHLAVADSANVVWVWDLFAMRSILRVTRPHPVRALAFGPYDDLLLLGNGKTVELWHMSELAKQP
ncbi:MAG: hypothetical protein K8U57_24530 [Planctomycetes bacterium]|nr:hypothetical protein [Planctomycetota bacterium]